MANVASRPDSIHPRLNQQQQFRTVKLNTPLADGIVRCSMLVRDLDDRSTSYIALSYMWGTDEPTYEIFIDEKPFKVRSNLAQFLARAQRWGLAPIFIDALCINQADINERNQQVKLMGQIYTNAEKVISWLGHGNERVEGAIPFVKQFLPLSNGLLQNFYTGKEYNIREAQQPWNLVHLFTNLRYWTRVWMVQEISLARAITYIYGEHSIEGEDLFEFSQALRETNPCPAPLPDLLFGSRCFSYPEGGSKTPFFASGSSLQANLIDVLWEYGHSVCGEKRDRVYALLSLAKEGLHFPVNYGISLAVLYSQAWQFRPKNGVHLMAFTKHMIQALLDSPKDIDESRDFTRPKVYRFRLYPVRFSQISEHFPSCSTTPNRTFSSINANCTIEYQPTCNGPIQSLRLRARPVPKFTHPQTTIRVNTDINRIKNQAFEPNDEIFDIENSGLLVVGRRDAQNNLRIVAELSLSAGLSHDDGMAEITARWYPWSSMLERMKIKYQAYSIETIDGTSFLCFNEMALRTFMSGLHYERNFVQVYTTPPNNTQQEEDDHSTYEVDLLSVHWYQPSGQYSLTEIAMLQNVHDFYFRVTQPGSPPVDMSISKAIHGLTRSKINLYESGEDRGEDKPLPWRDLLESKTDMTKMSNLFY